MMDAARAADQSWPHRNIQFRRSWVPPPEKRSPALGPTSNRAVFVSISNGECIDAAASAQRACSVATRQADRLERRAGALAALGQREAALRFAALAGQMRAAAA